MRPYSGPPCITQTVHGSFLSTTLVAHVKRVERPGSFSVWVLVDLRTSLILGDVEEEASTQ